MQLRPGLRLRSTACETEVVVVRAPAGDVEMQCGGEPMVIADGERGRRVKVASPSATGTVIGKRYAHEGMGLEVLCVRAGTGSLEVEGESLTVREAKPLPSSD